MRPTPVATQQQKEWQKCPTVTPPRPHSFCKPQRRSTPIGVSAKGPSPRCSSCSISQGTLDNWDPAVTDPLAAEREVILFDNAGVGRSTGKVPHTVDEMAEDVFAFLDGLGITTCDVLGFSLGGMIAQQMAQERPSIFRRIILVGTAPRGGEDIMHLEKPRLAKFLNDLDVKGYVILQKIFFALTDSSQAAGEEFIKRLAQRKEDRDPLSGPEVAAAQMASFRDWEKYQVSVLRP